MTTSTEIETAIVHSPAGCRQQENAPQYFIRETMSGSLWQQLPPAGHLLG
jgi:hypothetical protein